MRRSLETTSRHPAPSERVRRPSHPVLALQQSAGNRAVGLAMTQPALQRFFGPSIFGPVGDILGLGIDVLFGRLVASNRADATPISVPAGWLGTAEGFVEANKSTVPAFLPLGLKRKPRFHKGGWILDLVPDAVAITLDNDVFVRGELDIDTYVHEAVHVGQYLWLGRSGFLREFFGGAAIDIVRRLLRREEIDMAAPNWLEKQAYKVEKDFSAWRAANP